MEIRFTRLKRNAVAKSVTFDGVRLVRRISPLAMGLQTMARRVKLANGFYKQALGSLEGQVLGCVISSIIVHVEEHNMQLMQRSTILIKSNPEFLI